MTSITFESGSKLQKINKGSFSSTALEKVLLPASVSIIEAGAFENCSSLTWISFESGSLLTSIGDSAFSRSGLKSIFIPAMVSYIASNAFHNVTSKDAFSGVSDFTVYVDPRANYQGKHNLTHNFSANSFFGGINAVLINVSCNGVNTTLGEIAIGSVVSEIADFAFYNCSNVNTCINIYSVCTLHGFQLHIQLQCKCKEL